MKLLIPSIAITSLLITSCSTTESFVNDDIYSVRPSELPIGESLTDETSYASFKSRKLGKTNDRATYADEVALRNRQNCLDQWSWYDGCGCSYREWAMYSRYSHNNRFNNMNRMIYWNHPAMAYGFAISSMYPYGIRYGMYSGNMYPYHHNPYIMMDPWYGGYGYGWNSPYGGYYGSNPYYPYGYYGYGYGGYGYGGNMNGWNNSSSHSGVTSNVIRGPRGTSSGYSNPSGRAVNYDKVQVGKVNTPTSAKGNLSGTRATTTVTKPIDSKSVISRVNTPTYSRDNVNGGFTPTTSTSSRPNIERASTSPSRSSANPTVSSPSRTNPSVSSSPSRNTNSEYQRTYPSRTSSPSGNLRPETATGRSNTISTPQRTSSPDNGSYSSPSRGSSNSGMGSSSSGSGGGRSGASSSSGSSTGRR